MDSAMATDPSASVELLRRAGAGDRQAVNELFARYPDRLRAMVRFGRGGGLRGGSAPWTVLRKAFLEIGRRFPAYVGQPPLPFFLWLRHITGQKLIDAHRQPLGAQMRDAGQEVSLYRGALPQ